MESGEIITSPDSKRKDHHLLQAFGKLTMREDTFFHGPHEQQAQTSMQLNHCIKNSITDETHIKIVAKQKEYIKHGAELCELLFKLLMQKGIIDTCSISSHLREKL